MNSKTTISMGICYHQQLVAEGIAAAISSRKNLVLEHFLPFENDNCPGEITTTSVELLILEFAYISNPVLLMLGNIRANFPSLKILIVSGMVSRHYLNELMKKADGYVLRTCSHATLFKALDEVLASGKFLCQQLMDEIIDHQLKHPMRNALTLRENEILLSWFSLNSTSEIAKKLYISQPTVRTHLKNIREKFGKPYLMKMLFYACQETQFNSDSEPICPYCKTFCTAKNIVKKM